MRLCVLSRKYPQGKNKMKKPISIVALTTATILSLTLLACAQKAQSAADSQSATEIKIDNFSFAPQTLEITAGTTVTWTNKDDVPHNVVSTDKIFKSKTMDTDEKFSYTFTKPGTYNYFCSIHPRMTATVVVK
jgi:plastocyanin